MNRTARSAAICIVAVSALAFVALLHSQQPPSAAKRVPVIVELFTSEGCSSCPPADDLLAKLDAIQPVANAEIIPIEEHVDYWNSQGWLDPFASANWTERQRVYASVLHSGSVFTPQMVVNGESQLVGSHGRDAVQAIGADVAPDPTDISAKIAVDSPKNERVQIQVGKLSAAKNGDSAEVWLAITEAGLHNAVTRGENAGHELSHAPVLRSLKKLGTADPAKDPSFTSEASVHLDSSWKTQNLRTVIFVQEKKSRRILAAAETTPNPQP